MSKSHVRVIAVGQISPVINNRRLLEITVLEDDERVTTMEFIEEIDSRAEISGTEGDSIFGWQSMDGLVLE